MFGTLIDRAKRPKLQREWLATYGHFDFEINRECIVNNIIYEQMIIWCYKLIVKLIIRKRMEHKWERE